MKRLTVVILTVVYFNYFYSLIRQKKDDISVPKMNIYPSEVEYNSTKIFRSNRRVYSTYPIRIKVRKHNTEQTIYNEFDFGPLRNDSIVILIQVHNRIAYLRHLIKSLSEVEGISNHLLVFSHDYYDKMLNTLVRSIHFCKTMQIFYPYSVQMYQLKFPGDDTAQCPLTNESLTLKRHEHCRTSYDLYGNIRQAKYSQIKHHWWWNWCRIFDELSVTSEFTGLVIYLEEDYYVLKDFTHVLQLMYRKSVEMFPDVIVNIISLQSRSIELEDNTFNQVTIDDWSQGIAMNRTTWDIIRLCSKYFCKYDDYNWDWSFTYVATKCPLVTMTTKLSRIYNIGDCGMHLTSKSCKPWLAVKQIKDFINHNRNFKLFPNSIEVVRSVPRETHGEFPFGGWGDIRDHKLCMEMAWKSII